MLKIRYLTVEWQQTQNVLDITIQDKWSMYDSLTEYLSIEEVITLRNHLNRVLENGTDS